MLRISLCFLLCVCVIAQSIELKGEPASYLTDYIAVSLKPNGVATHIAERHNITLVRRSFHSENLYLFKLPHSEHEPRLHLSPEITWFERQVANRRFTRDEDTEWFSDPQFPLQWHLHDPVQGNDLAAQGAWSLGFTGNNILISVVDDGLDFVHPDFFNSYVPEASYDFGDNDANPTPSSFDKHGTEAAGCATAIADNNVCGTGVAPNAKVAGVRLLVGDPSDFQEAESLQYRNDIVDIYSSSWGPFDDGSRLEGPGPLLMGAFETTTSVGRNGKGSVLVWAGGNGLRSGDNCNYDGFANSRYTIAVGAVGRDGIQSYYSEPCAALVVVAPSSDSRNNIITSYSDDDDECANTFGGTSAACPMVSGTVALCLEANPELTWRDVQGVLIDSAVKTDPTDSDWYSNAAGKHVNHKYGFGRINATAAVETALTWQNMGDEILIESGIRTVEENIPEESSISFTWICSQNIIVEHVDIFFDASHTHRGQLRITITSPKGTESVLAEKRNDRNPNYAYWKFMTIRNWGEGSFGPWTITVSDETHDNTIGMLNFFEINIYGHEHIGGNTFGDDNSQSYDVGLPSIPWDHSDD